jgi:very-short-patch-repair endonuclease
VGVKNHTERLKGTSRRLRKNSTDTEKFLWKHLRNKQLRGFKFRRQQPIGRYIVDFVNFEENLIIEVDGGQHAIYREQDIIRDAYLKQEGYMVLRFWDNEVLNNIEGVLDIIDQNLSPSPRPSPIKGEGERDKTKT